MFSLVPTRLRGPLHPFLGLEPLVAWNSRARSLACYNRTVPLAVGGSKIYALSGHVNKQVQLLLEKFRVVAYA